MTPIDAIKKVGRGKTLSQNLSTGEAEAAFAALCDARYTPVQFGAFLQALRIKELTQDELNALYCVVRNRLVTTASEANPYLTLNLASDTARKGGLLSLLAAQVLAHAGLEVAVVRSEPVLSRNRDAYVLTRALRSAAPRLHEASLADLLPGWSHLDSLRHELGFRSCLHTVEKMLNPHLAAPLVLGISHRHYAERMALAFQSQGQRCCIVLGNHGTPDAVLHKPTELFLVHAGGITTRTLEPEMGGLKPDPGIYALAQFPAWKAWFEQGWPMGFRDALIFQTFLLMLAAEPSTLNADALPLAAQRVHAWEKAN